MMDTKEQWPPAPTNLPRVVVLGEWRLEIDAEQLCGVRLDARKRRWVRRIESGVNLLTALFVFIEMATHVWAPTLIEQSAAAAVILFAAAFVMNRIAVRSAAEQPFVIRRAPIACLRGRDGERSLATPWRFWVSRVRGGWLRVCQLNVTLDELDGSRVRTLALARFAAEDDARRVQSEIVDFLRAG